MKLVWKGLSTTVCLWSFKKGGSRAGEAIYIIWRVPALSTDRDETAQARVVARCMKGVPVYLSRLQKQLFVAHVVDCDFIKGRSRAQAVYEFITGNVLPSEKGEEG